MMKSSSSGSRHTLLLYRRSMDRIWKLTLFLGILLVAVGYWTLIRPTIIFGLESDLWLFAAAMIAFALCIFAFIARYFAYVQPNPGYLKFVTPFLRFKISFQRVRSIRPTLVQQVFPPEASSWAERSYLEPFYGKTLLVMELKSYPLNPTLMKLFIPAQLFSPKSTGMVLLVPDWMKLSTELDSLIGSWQQERNRARAARNR
jgi:hypothetical protein